MGGKEKTLQSPWIALHVEVLSLPPKISLFSNQATSGWWKLFPCQGERATVGHGWLSTSIYNVLTLRPAPCTHTDMSNPCRGKSGPQALGHIGVSVSCLERSRNKETLLVSFIFGSPFLWMVMSLCPLWLRWWRICLQCRRPRFDPGVGKMPWRREWQSTPVFLPREFHGQRSLMGYSPWDHKESDTTERLHFHAFMLLSSLGITRGR